MKTKRKIKTPKVVSAIEVTVLLKQVYFSTEEICEILTKISKVNGFKGFITIDFNVDQLPIIRYIVDAKAL